MRMWMVEPVLMCSQHLRGEHVELHMFVGALCKRKSISGYIANDLLQPLAIQARHEQVIAELAKRGGWRHRSPIEQPPIEHLSTEQLNHVVNSEDSLAELLRRCPRCRERAEQHDRQYDKFKF